MLTEKKALSFEELESQTALELPDREMLALVNVTLVDVASGNQIALALPIGMAANVCGINAAVLAADLNQDGSATCTAQVNQETMQRLQRQFRNQQ